MSYIKLLGIFWLFLVLLPTHSIAEGHSITEGIRGRIVKIDGVVRIINAKGKEIKPETVGYSVRELDTIVTRQGGHAVVEFKDGVLTVLDDKSRLKVGKPGFLSHLAGKMYFLFQKLVGRQSQEINTQFATLGIRGTTFIVYDNEAGQGVALQEGRLNVESPGPAFELHRRKKADEYEDYVKEFEDGMKAMKEEYLAHRERLNREFVEYKKKFVLAPGRVIRFDGNRVDESGFTDDMEAEFDRFERFAAEFLKDNSIDK